MGHTIQHMHLIGMADSLMLHTTSTIVSYQYRIIRL
jgi:hypothetical protein